MVTKQRLDIKPLSVNKAWQGRRFKTDAYKSFEREMLLRLKTLKVESISKLTLEFGFSSRLSDIDNPVKIVTDCLCKKYGFDDRDIYELNVTKSIVPKGKEFIKFELG